MSSVDGASFRDPSGFVFEQDGIIYRQVNNSYKDDYDTLMDSGLYEALVDKNLLVAHKEVELDGHKDGYKIIEPALIPYFTYPYEWSFTQLKDAALLTLEIQNLAIKHKMSLKDASAYNIAFVGGKPVFFDTLSFESMDKPKPWVAYRQFCQHFLAPLALMAHTDVHLNQLFRTNIDGVPLELASKILPAKTKRIPGLLMHIHTHAKSQKKNESRTEGVSERTVTENGLLGILGSLKSNIKKLEWKRKGTEWGEYYTFTNYSDDSFEKKKEIINGFLDEISPQSAYDMGANNGLFSRLASDRGIRTVAFDIDPVAVEKNYLAVKHNKEENILPAIMDLTNPSPGIGWAGEERLSLESRGKADVVFSLALIHHIALSNNVPFEKIADYFSRLGQNLIMEFVPKGDSQVDILLATREDVFPDYNEEGFEEAFTKYFETKQKTKIDGTKRTLYLLQSKEA